MKRIKDLELAFLLESNRIENIDREANKKEFAAFDRFMELRTISIDEVCGLVQAFQPDAKLRTRSDLNVVVGRHIPPMGGMHIFYELEHLINEINNDLIGAYHAHHKYETLHPFTDGNGRSGRIIWWRMMGGSPYGFLRHWYYQSLEYGRDR